MRSMSCANSVAVSASAAGRAAAACTGADADCALGAGFCAEQLSNKSESKKKARDMYAPQKR
jgi:hypothetical protein